MNELNLLLTYFQYDATALGGHGTGGEYEVQLGFGWTNGVILDLLDQYPAELTSTPSVFAPAPLQDSPAHEQVNVPAVSEPGSTHKDIRPISNHTQASSSSGLVASMVFMALLLASLAIGGAIW